MNEVTGQYVRVFNHAVFAELRDVAALPGESRFCRIWPRRGRAPRGICFRSGANPWPQGNQREARLAKLGAVSHLGIQSDGQFQSIMANQKKKVKAAAVDSGLDKVTDYRLPRGYPHESPQVHHSVQGSTARLYANNECPSFRAQPINGLAVNIEDRLGDAVRCPILVDGPLASRITNVVVEYGVAPDR